MWPEIASKVRHAYHRYFCVKPAPVADEVARATESASRAVAAALTNAHENDRLAHDMAKLDSLLRSGGPQ